MTNGPRWLARSVWKDTPTTSRVGEKSGEVFVGRYGEYDLWRRGWDRFYIVIEAPRSGSEWTFTNFETDAAGRIKPVDNDVPATPELMCVMYRLMKETTGA